VSGTSDDLLNLSRLDEGESLGKADIASSQRAANGAIAGRRLDRLDLARS
jgi:hypothetical protein